MKKASDAVRTLPYPVLESGNLSYERGSYEVSSHGADGASVELTHIVTGAPLVQSLLREDKARYACLVSVPVTGYRRLETSFEPRQTVRWDVGFIGEPPMLRPMILAMEEVERVLGPEAGVAAAWQGFPLTIPRGARLAVHEYLRMNSSVSQLLELHPDRGRPDGTFEVAECSEEGYYFRVKMAEDLFAFLRQPRGHQHHRRSILTHVTSRSLELLQRQYGAERRDDPDNDWKSYRNLKALAAELQARGLPCWDDDGFDASDVATRLYPHQVPEAAGHD